MNFNFQVNSKAKATYALFFPFLLSSLKQKSKVNTSKCHEEPSETELPVNQFDIDDPEFEQLQQILNDPNIDPETYKEIMMEQKNVGITPMKFNQLHGGIKNDLEDELWGGLRLSLNWKPTNMFTTETMLTLDNKAKPMTKYRLSATTIVPGNNFYNIK